MKKIKKMSAKERILESAMNLFHGQGISGTGVDQILKASETGKGQFYYYFESKDDLVLQVMGMFFDGLRAGEIGPSLVLKGWKDLELWFSFFIEAQKGMKCGRHCPIATMASEFTEDQEVLMDEAGAIFDFSRQRLVDFFELMKERGKIGRGNDATGLADFCYTIMQGGMLVAKVKRDIEPFEQSVKHALKYVKSLRV